MGFNTTIVIYNDHLDVIESDPDFGKKLVQAIQHIDYNHNVPIYATGRFVANVGEVVESHHADFKVLVEIGGNTGKLVSIHDGEALTRINENGE